MNVIKKSREGRGKRVEKGDIFNTVNNRNMYFFKVSKGSDFCGSDCFEVLMTMKQASENTH